LKDGKHKCIITTTLPGEVNMFHYHFCQAKPVYRVQPSPSLRQRVRGSNEFEFGVWKKDNKIKYLLMSFLHLDSSVPDRYDLKGKLEEVE